MFHVNVYVLIESYTDEVFIKEFVMVDTCTCDIPFVICVEASNHAYEIFGCDTSVLPGCHFSRYWKGFPTW